MGDMQDTAIIVPCYNEEIRLPVDDFFVFARQNKDLHFIFVDDCSTDGTRQVIDRLCSRLPAQFFALHLPRNLGKAGAVREGFLRAFAKDYALIGFWDADLATPLSSIVTFRTLLASNPALHMVIGARVRLLNRRIDRQLKRHYLGRVFATMASFVMAVSVYDTQCGAKIFVNTPLLRQVFAKPFMVNWIFDVEILARYLLLAQQTGGRPLGETVCEYPLEQWRDVPGSKIKAMDFMVAAYELAKIWGVLHGPFRSRYCKGLSGSVNHP